MQRKPHPSEVMYWCSNIEVLVVVVALLTLALRIMIPPQIRRSCSSPPTSQSPKRDFYPPPQATPIPQITNPTWFHVEVSDHWGQSHHWGPLSITPEVEIAAYSPNAHHRGHPPNRRQIDATLGTRSTVHEPRSRARATQPSPRRTWHSIKTMAPSDSSFPLLRVEG